MTAEIISVGTELLMGQIVNTNSQYIFKRLSELGVNVYCETTVGDNAQRLQNAIETALSRADTVILTGGLGPTVDDITKEIAAQVMGKTLKLHEESAKAIDEYFKKRGIPMPPQNEKQAMLPDDGIILENECGTAPGCIMEKDGKSLILLPGPPYEMQAMFESKVAPYLKCGSDAILYSRIVRIYGIGESQVQQELIDIFENQTNPTIAPYVKTGETTLRITARCHDEEEGEKMISPILDEIQRRLGTFVYSTNDEELEEVVVKLLKEKGKTIALAESCSGGLIASKIVSVSGCSEVFIESAVTYSNDAKMRRLGVREETLKAYGAVSFETACEMAQGIRTTSGAQIGASVTGIAGPGGGSEEKPVGLVYIAVADENGVNAKELRLGNVRSVVRERAAKAVIDMVRQSLIK
ncbi:MAG: competence/damage-inducible protein A [Clostridia bacterium]|nr:competence/damage-inducible protein A [Clostridia bacterium]